VSGFSGLRYSSLMTEPMVRDVAPWVERLARVGYVSKAVLYITVGVLAAQAGLGSGGHTTDTRGAMKAVHDVSFGRVLLMVVAAGLLGYAIWRVTEALVDPEGRGTNTKALAIRAGSFVRGAFHAGLALTAFRLAVGRSGQSGDQTRHWTATAFHLPGGELLVWAGAIGVGGYGLYQLYRAYAAKLGRQLEVSRLATNTGKWVVGVSRFGIAARGVVFCSIGVFLARAAARHDAAEAGGVRQSLRTIAGYGRWPFVLVSLGLVAYGVYELVNARYRRINVA
jgi:hypothetical protein